MAPLLRACTYNLDMSAVGCAACDTTGRTKFRINCIPCHFYDNMQWKPLVGIAVSNEPAHNFQHQAVSLGTLLATSGSITYRQGIPQLLVYRMC